MRHRIALTLAATMLIASATASAAEPSFGKDLTATIALHGMPCDKVTDAKRNGDSEDEGGCRPKGAENGTGNHSWPRATRSRTLGLVRQGLTLRRREL